MFTIIELYTIIVYYIGNKICNFGTPIFHSKISSHLDPLTKCVFDKRAFTVVVLQKLRWQWVENVVIPTSKVEDSVTIEGKTKYVFLEPKVFI